MKKLLSFILAALLAVAFIPSALAEDNVTWTYDEETKTIVISGSGALTDGNPWSNYLDGAEAIRIEQGITSIGNSVFMMCGTVKSITIPEGVTSIGVKTFYLSSELESVSLPSTLVSIGESAFEGCSSLTSVTLPEKLAKLGDKAFANCHALAAFAVSDANASFCAVDGVLFSKDKTVLVAYPGGKADEIYSVPDGTVEIGKDAFAYDRCLKGVVLPDSVQKIDDFGFYFVKNLDSVAFGSGLKSVGESAFYGCGLTAPYLPYGLETIGSKAFKNCAAMRTAVIPSTVKTIGDDVFYGCNDALEIGCYGGSAIAQYAANAGINLKAAVSVFVNGDELSFDVPATIREGHTMVPMRKIFEALGAEVTWDSETSTAMGTMGDVTVSITIGDNVLYKNSTSVELATPAVIEGSRTLVPARAVAEAFGAQVEWDGTNGVVNITE